MRKHLFCCIYLMYSVNIFGQNITSKIDESLPKFRVSTNLAQLFYLGLTHRGEQQLFLETKLNSLWSVEVFGGYKIYNRDTSTVIKKGLLTPTDDFNFIRQFNFSRSYMYGAGIRKYIDRSLPGFIKEFVNVQIYFRRCWYDDKIIKSVGPYNDGFNDYETKNSMNVRMYGIRFLYGYYLSTRITEKVYLFVEGSAGLGIRANKAEVEVEYLTKRISGETIRDYSGKYSTVNSSPQIEVKLGANFR